MSALYPRKFVTYPIRLSHLWLAVLLFVLSVGVPVVAAGPFTESEVVIVYSYDGENIGDGFGWVGANLGDLDNDGVADFGTTAPFYGGDDANGKAYIYSGKSGALLHEMTGEAGNRLGYSMAGAGDVNGDDRLDYVVGGPGGRVVVLSGVDHSLLLDLTSPEAITNEWFGASVAGAGDVNGDNHDDLFIGALRANASDTITQTGRVYLLSGMDGTVLWSQLGEAPQGQLGSGVGAVGDVNGDSIPDQVAAAPGAGEGGLGEAYVYSGVDGAMLYALRPVSEAVSGGTFGTFFAAGAGDVDKDGTPDIFIGDYAAQRGEAAGTGRAYVFSGVDGTPIHVFEAESDGDGLGPGRGIADVNGDGHADLSIAAWTSSAGTPNGGKVYIYSGADGAVLHTATGTIEGDSLGVDALSVGDVTGDGDQDYMLTAVGKDFSGSDVGHVYIVRFAEPSAQLTMSPMLGGCRPIQPE